MLFEQKLIETNDIIKILKYTTANVKEHKMLLIHDISSVDIVKQSSKIGNPESINLSPSQSCQPNMSSSSSSSSMPGNFNATANAANSCVSNEGRGGLTIGINPTIGSQFSSTVNSSNSNQSFGMSSNNTGAGFNHNGYNVNGNNYSNPSFPSNNNNSNGIVKNVSSQNNSFLGSVNSGNVVHTTTMQTSQQNKNSSLSPSNNVSNDSTIIHPINGISPYHNKWTIKARVSNKTDIKKWANNKGEGRLFSFTLIDESGEIRATAFNDSVDKFYNLIQAGHVYLISNGVVKIAKRQFNANSDYEIHLENNTTIQPTDDSTSIPAIKYDFIPISEIINKPKDSFVDILAIAKEVGELSSVTAKSTGKPISKRDLVLVDSSHSTIRLTIWGSMAENLDTSLVNPVIAIRHARVSDYNNRSLSTGGSSTDFIVEPQTHEAFKIKKWYESSGKSEPCTTLTVSSIGGISGVGSSIGGSSSFSHQDDRKTISMIKEDSQHLGDRPEYCSLVATITFIKTDTPLFYTACPKEDCNKKVIEEGPSIWRCEKCNRTYDRCDYRYILNLQVSDHTGQIWINTFNDSGNMIIGKTAEEMNNLKQIDENQFNEIIKQASFKDYTFRIKIKQENYQGEVKIRNSIISLSSPNFIEESKRLLNFIEQSS